MMPQRYPARDPAGQAGICSPSIRSSLARSAVAYSVAPRSVRPRMGRPVRASTSRLKPRLRPVTRTTMTARPMNRPARWLIMASHVRGDTRSRRRNMAPTLWHGVRGCHLIDPRERGEGNPTSLRAVRTMVPARCRHGVLCPMDTTRPARAPVVQQPDAESVLVQARSAGQTYASDPEMRQAVREVVAALRALPQSAAGIESPLTNPHLVSGRSALVTFNVAGKPDHDDQAVVPALNAVAAVQAHHPGL